MQGNSVLCSSSNSVTLSLTLSIPSPFAAAAFRVPASSSHAASSRAAVPPNLLRHQRRSPPPVHCSATQEILENCRSEFEFVEIGYISSVHGLQGEIRIKPNTGFPELRFSKPGRRWLRRQILGRETIQEVELVEGRDHPGQKSWIVRFSGIDTVDLAKQLVGSTVLVKDEDRPELEDGEFYTRDLIGMRVVLQETREVVGVVVNIFNSGASDLLHVLLDSSKEMHDATGKPKLGTSVSGHHVWVPFVEAIVPIVDKDRREMRITPPKGLLDLNLRSDKRSKKERRQLEWKQRKKFQQQLIAAKKKLREMEQQHVFNGFGFGDKAQKRLLADEIIGVNSKLLQLLLRDTVTLSRRWEFSEFMSAKSAMIQRSTLRMSEGPATLRGSKRNLNSNVEKLRTGLDITSEGKVAIILVVNGDTSLGTACDPDSFLQRLLEDGQKFVKMENRASVPLILVGAAQETQYIEKLFSDNDHFAFDPKKVWFLEELKLPVVSCPVGAENSNKILMKSPWEILQSPVGSGGVISLLSSNAVLEKLGEMGVEYIEIRTARQRYVCEHPVLLGFVNSHEADIGIQIFQDWNDLEDSFDLIFSMKFMKKLVKQIDKLQFHAVLKPHTYVEMVDKEWVDVVPSSPNTFEFSCSIYSSLNACSSDKICVLEISK